MDGLKIALEDSLAAPGLRCARSGRGEIELAVVGGRTRAVRAVAGSPLKLIIPESGQSSASIFTSTLGGGLVAGDEIRLDLRASAGTTTFLTTQSATKVFRGERLRDCRQRLDATVEDSAILIVWPDPIICFADAVYDQRQEFSLDAGASLALVDWQISGRRARGERWAFARYATRNVVRVGGRMVLNDSLCLDSADAAVADPFRAGRFECFATVVLMGPAMATLADKVQATIQAMPLGRRVGLLASASAISGGLIVRVGGEDPEEVMRYLRGALSPLSVHLGHDPWSRKW